MGSVRMIWLAVLLGICAGACLAQTPPSAHNRPRANWDFKFKDFVIGAWWGPGATDAEMKLYKEAGFNVVMSGRYMQLDAYGDADKGLQELDLAHKYGLGVLFDTYTKNDRPWGGKAGPVEPHPNHHPASLPELQWLYARLHRHPALIGFMIGDDQGEVSSRAADCTQFLYAQPRPHLMPWLCGWIAPQNLAAHNNPIEDPQIYPTLYAWDLPADALAQQYAAAYAGTSRQCRDLGVIFWPMFNTTLGTQNPTGKDMFGYCPSDSLVRFPAYAALAYGAEGIWYFTYNGGALEHAGVHQTAAEAQQALTPLYPVAKAINQRIAAWGPRLLGRTSTGLFGTAFGTQQPDWPFPEDAAAFQTPEALTPPTPGKLVEALSDDLLVGILMKRGKKPLAMVVNCRTSKGFGDLPAREVTLQFAPAVTAIHVLEGKEAQPLQGNSLELTLEPGGGQLLELEGKGLDSLCAPAAIYAVPKAGRAATAARSLTAADLAGLRAARLRIDVYGADGRPQYAAKYIDINGHRLSTVPANNSDTWTFKTVAFDPSQLAWIRRANEVTVRTECDDSWKFRNLTLAVQLADGTWVKTGADTTVHSTPNWAHSEGTTWGKDGIAGPIRLALP